MTPNKLEVIRQKCIEANPSIEHRDQPADYYASRRPIKIRLADVLLAMFEVENWRNKWVNKIVARWKLTEDDLTKQEPETITFLYDLLND